MDTTLSAKGCITAFNAMGGVDVHIILPLPKYIRQGELVASEKTKEELSESLSATASADEMKTECDGGSFDSKGNVSDLIVEAAEAADAADAVKKKKLMYYYCMHINTSCNFFETKHHLKAYQSQQLQ